MLDFINGEKIAETKRGKMSFNGEVVLYARSVENNYYKCQGEYLNGKVSVRSFTAISEKHYADPFTYKKSTSTPVKAVSISDEEVISQENFTPINHFEDCRFFASGKLHIVKKEELSELALSISDWSNKTTVTEQAMFKTYEYMQHRFKNDLTEAEIKEYTIDLLKIRTEQFDETIGTPRAKEEIIDSRPQIILPEINNVKICEPYLIKVNNSEVAIGKSKVGGFPDLMADDYEEYNLSDFDFIAQINTKDIPNLSIVVPKGLLSFFIPRSFGGLDYWKVNRLKVIFREGLSKLSRIDKGQDVLDQKLMAMDLLDVSKYNDENELSHAFLNSQFMPDLAKDSFAEQLMLQSIGAEDNEIVAEKFPELVGGKSLDMVPILKICDIELKKNGKGFYDSMNIVFFLSQFNLEISNFDDCYFAMEP